MRARHVLLQDAMGWRVAAVRGEQVRLIDVEGEDPEADRIVQALRDAGHKGQGVCLALGSEHVLSAGIDSTSLPRSQRRSAMLYRLEEQLSLDIEMLTVDFLPPAAGRIVGVATETEPVRELAESLADAGIKVSAICPASLLALWRVLDEADGCDYVLLAGRSGTDLFRLHDGRPVTWYSPGEGPADTVQCLQADQLVRPVEGPEASVCVVGPEQVSSRQLAGEGSLRVVQASIDDPARAAALAGAALLAGESAGWVDLRRDRLSVAGSLGRAGRLFRATLAMTAVAVVLLAGAFLTNSLRYAHKAKQSRAEGERIYRELYGLSPERAIYFSVPRRLASDRRRLEGLSGFGEQVPARASALETLRRLLIALPSDIRFRILELRLSPSEVFIEGETRGHGDAETLRAALSAAELELAPPRTESIGDQQVAFSLVGRPADSGGSDRSGGRP